MSSIGTEFDVRAIVQHRGLSLTTREWEEILPVVWKAAGEFWHETILPKHFTFAGAQEYAYAARTKGHMIRKAKRLGHQAPLVFSGKTRSAVVGLRDVRADKDGVQIVLRQVPQYIWMSQHQRAPVIARLEAEAQAAFKAGRRYRGFRKQQSARQFASLPNMVAELTAISDNDREQIAKVIDRAFGNEFHRRDTANQLMLIGQQEAMAFGV